MAGRIGRSRGPGEPVHRITSAQEALSDDQARRTRRYLITMGIRTACFLGLIFVDGVWQWVCIAGAVFLPYIAVVMANAGRENDRFANAPVSPVSRTEIGSTPMRVIPAPDPMDPR
jgi:predicted tellurium resistance membrane protein TerC